MNFYFIETLFHKKYRITRHQNKEDRKWLWVMISYQTTTWPSQGRSISIQTELTWYGCNTHSAQIYIQFSADEHNIKYYTYIDEVTLNGVARVKHRWSTKILTRYCVVSLKKSLWRDCYRHVGFSRQEREREREREWYRGEERKIYLYK